MDAQQLVELVTEADVRIPDLWVELLADRVTPIPLQRQG